MAEVPIGTEIPVILQELQHRHSHDSTRDSEKTAATPTLYADEKSIANATEEREESVADSRRSTDMKAPYEASLREKQEEVLARIETTTSNGEIEYPTGLKLTFITIALCLSVLCMALVSCPLRVVEQSLPSNPAGQHDHRNCDSQNHRRVPGIGRCRLVRQCILVDHMRLPTLLWQTVHST